MLTNVKCDVGWGEHSSMFVLVIDNGSQEMYFLADISNLLAT